MAKKILFDENREAVGVNVEAQGSQNWEYTLYANKEVIISAGTVSIYNLVAHRLLKELSGILRNCLWCLELDLRLRLRNSIFRSSLFWKESVKTYG